MLPKKMYALSRKLSYSEYKNVFEQRNLNAKPATCEESEGVYAFRIIPFPSVLTGE